MGVTLAVVGAIVAEWAGGERGLGVLINLARGSLFDIPLMFATLLTIALLGITLYLAVVAHRAVARARGHDFDPTQDLTLHRDKEHARDHRHRCPWPSRDAPLRPWHSSPVARRGHARTRPPSGPPPLPRRP